MWKQFVTIASGPFKAPNETKGISDDRNAFPPTVRCSLVLALVTSVTLVTFMLLCMQLERFHKKMPTSISWENEKSFA